MSTVGNIKEGLTLALELANASTRAEDVTKIIAMQQQVMEVLEDNRELSKRVAELEDELAIDSRLVREGFEYFVRNDDESETGPVCPGCYKRDRVVTKLRHPPHWDLTHFQCSRCREQYILDRPR